MSLFNLDLFSKKHNDDSKYEIAPKEEVASTMQTVDNSTADLDELLQYLSIMSNDYRPKTLFIEREDENIVYGEISCEGIRNEYHRFRFINTNILKVIYGLISVKFSDTLVEQVTMGFNGLCLTPFITEETEIDISSDNADDFSWIMEEKDRIYENKKNKKGIMF